MKEAARDGVFSHPMPLVDLWLRTYNFLWFKSDVLWLCREKQRGENQQERGKCTKAVPLRCGSFLKSNFLVVLWAIKSLNTSFFCRLLFRFKCELITMKYLTTKCLLMDQLAGGSITLADLIRAQREGRCKQQRAACLENSFGSQTKSEDYFGGLF